MNTAASLLPLYLTGNEFILIIGIDGEHHTFDPSFTLGGVEQT